MLTRLTIPASTETPAARPRRSSDFTGLQTAVLFAALGLVAVIPIITHPLPPLSDYVNHLARTYVIATSGHDPDLSRFYGIEWQIVPNLVIDLVVPVLARAMTIYHAGQLFTIATFMLILSGTVMFNRALFRSWSVLPLLAFPLLYKDAGKVNPDYYAFQVNVAIEEGRERDIDVLVAGYPDEAARMIEEDQAHY